MGLLGNKYGVLLLAQLELQLEQRQLLGHPRLLLVRHSPSLTFMSETTDKSAPLQLPAHSSIM